MSLELNPLLLSILKKEVFNVAKDVKCEVNNCNYWGAGNLCNASSINVVGRTSRNVTTSEETDCKTFEPKV